MTTTPNLGLSQPAAGATSWNHAPDLATIDALFDGSTGNHDHNGTDGHGKKLAQANTHESPDTDAGTGSLHHTLGTGANQAAAGDHTHAGGGGADLSGLIVYPGDLIVGGPGGVGDHTAGTTTGWSHNTSIEYGSFPGDLTDTDDGTNVGFATQVGGIAITYHALLPIQVGQLSLSQDGASDPSGRNAFVLESSPDGSTWTTRLDINSGEAFGAEHTYDLDTPATAEYWRLRATMDTGDHWNVRHVALIGDGAAASPATLTIPNGSAHKFLKVNSTEDGYDFGLPPGNNSTGGPDATDVFGMGRFATKSAKIENLAVADVATEDLLTITGEGTVTAFTFVVGKSGGAADTIVDGILRIYVDGEGTAGIAFDLGTLGAHFMTEAVVQQTDHIGIEIAPSTDSTLSLPSAQVTFKFPIFFGSSVRFEFENPTSTDTLCFLNAFYTNDLVQNRRLKSAGVTYLNKETQAIADGDFEFLNLAAGNAGSIVWNSIAAHGVSDASFLEANVVAYIDGEGSASIQTSGTEDWFADSFYWATGPRSTPWAYLGTLDNPGATVAAALDLLAFCGGIRFTDGVRLVWELGGGFSDVEFSHLTLYYVGEDASGPIGLPTAPATGDMAYFDGTAWVSIPVAADGAVLTLVAGVPTWV